LAVARPHRIATATVPLRTAPHRSTPHRMHYIAASLTNVRNARERVQRQPPAAICR